MNSPIWLFSRLFCGAQLEPAQQQLLLSALSKSGFSAFLTLWPLNTVPRVLVTLNLTLFSLLLHKCNFATARNCKYLWFPMVSGVTTHRLRTSVLGMTFWLASGPFFTNILLSSYFIYWHGSLLSFYSLDRIPPQRMLSPWCRRLLRLSFPLLCGSCFRASPILLCHPLPAPLLPKFCKCKADLYITTKTLLLHQKQLTCENTICVPWWASPSRKEPSSISLEQWTGPFSVPCFGQEPHPTVSFVPHGVKCKYFIVTYTLYIVVDTICRFI